MITVVQVSTRMIHEFANGHSLLMHSGPRREPGFHVHGVFMCTRAQVLKQAHLYAETEERLIGQRTSSCEGISLPSSY